MSFLLLQKYEPWPLSFLPKYISSYDGLLRRYSDGGTPKLWGYPQIWVLPYFVLYHFVPLYCCTQFLVPYTRRTCKSTRFRSPQHNRQRELQRHSSHTLVHAHAILLYLTAAVRQGHMRTLRLTSSSALLPFLAPGGGGGHTGEGILSCLSYSLQRWPLHHMMCTWYLHFVMCPQRTKLKQAQPAQGATSPFRIT